MKVIKNKKGTSSGRWSKKSKNTQVKVIFSWVLIGVMN